MGGDDAGYREVLVGRFGGPLEDGGYRLADEGEGAGGEGLVARVDGGEGMGLGVDKGSAFFDGLDEVSLDLVSDGSERTHPVKEQTVGEARPGEPLMLASKLSQAIRVTNLASGKPANLCIVILARLDAKLGGDEARRASSDGGVNNDPRYYSAAFLTKTAVAPTEKHRRARTITA